MQPSPGIGTWRTKRIRAISLLLLILVIWTPLVEAAEGKRVAFVVGIGTYDNLGADKQLRNAVNDAEGVSAKLDGIGYQVTKAPDLARSVFSAKWQNVLDSLTRDDTFVLYFSGHGVQIDGQNYLLMRDIPWIEYGRQAQLTREAISLNEILSDLTTGARAHPKQSVVILDACRNNPLIPPGYKGIQTASGLAKPSATEGLFVIYSASENSVSLDRLANDNNSVKYSVFTRALLPLLTQPLTLQDLSVELKKNVLALTKRAQRPTYYDGTDGEPFCLPGCLSEADKNPVRFKENLTPSVHPTGKDGAPMVLIPVGSFQMGSTKDEVDRAIQTCVNEYKKDQQTCEGWFKGELPRHQVSLDAFYLDRYEVTNRLFARFVEATGHQTTAEKEGTARGLVNGEWKDITGATWRQPEGGVTVLASNRVEHPVVSVSWGDADAYCRWAGKRLPTEAEFEYATRAGTQSKYWWGNDTPGTRKVANVADEFLNQKDPGWVIMKGYNDGYERTAPVGTFESNPFQLFDMTGNVSEWTADWYDGGYYGKGPERNPKGPSSGQYRVLRGGSWLYAPDFVRSASRSWDVPTTRNDDIVFRCAQDIPN